VSLLPQLILSVLCHIVQATKTTVEMNCCSCDTTEDAARRGHLECVKRIIEEGGQWDGKTTLSAIIKGEMEILKFALDNDCPWHSRAAAASIQQKNSDYALYTLKRGAEWTSEEILKCKNKFFSPWYSDYLVENHEAGGTLPSVAVNMAIEEGRAETLNRICEIGVNLSPDDMLHAVETLNDDTVRVLIKHKCGWPPTMTAVLAKNWNLQMLEYVSKKGCPWDPDTTLKAVEDERCDTEKVIEIVLFVISKGCPLHHATVQRVAKWAEDADSASDLELLYESGLIKWDETFLEGSKFDTPLTADELIHHDFHANNYHARKYVGEIREKWIRGKNLVFAPKPAKRRKMGT
jgi:hypothetical protein